MVWVRANHFRLRICPIPLFRALAPPSLAGGLITRPVLALALVAGPSYGLGLYLGSRLFGRTSDRGYRWACYGLIAMASIVSLPALDSVFGR